MKLRHALLRLAALASLALLTLSAQPGPPPAAPSNLKFDEGEPGGAKVPGWFTPPAWTIAETRRGGECREGGCVMITRPEMPPPNSFGNLMQAVSAGAFAGKRVVYRVAVRVEGSQAEDVAMPWLRVDLPDRKMGFFDNMHNRPVRAGLGWAVYEIAGEVDREAIQIYFGVMAHGKARVWVDDASLEASAPVPEGPETAAARTAIAALYARIDAAQSTGGRAEDILAIAVPGAQGGSSMMRVPLTNFVAEIRKMLSPPGTEVASKTEIAELKLLSAGEAKVQTRGEARIKTADRSRILRGSSDDIWVRAEGGDWKLKETIVRSMREVQAAMPPEAVKRVGNAIAAQAAPLTTAVAGAPRADLAAFGKAIGAARIVALGEATHGSREIFQMKHRLLEYLVKEKGFTVFAIEANWPESQAADRYIKTGEGNPREALKDMYFWTWQTEEVLAMLEWMREFNKAPGDHPTLSFTAFDMQTWDVAATRVAAFIRQHGSKEDAAAVEAAYQGLAALPRRTQRDAAFAPAAKQAEKVTALFTARGEALAKSAGAPAFRDAVQMTRIVAQALRNRTQAAPPSYRDEMMAKNLKWLAGEAHPGEKIVVWAHNGHVSKSGDPASSWRPMGAWMRGHLTQPDEMYVVGFAIHTGSVRAVGGGRSRAGLSAYPVPPAPAGSGTAALSAAGKPIFFLDLKPAMEKDGGGALGEFLKSRQSFRECGAMWNLEESAEENTQVVALGESFDGLIFLEKTEAARGL